MNALTPLSLLAVLSFGNGLATPAHAASGVVPPPPGALMFELVGQVVNSAPGVTPATSNQFGYLAYLRGADTVFDGTVQNETTAVYTFFTAATTTRVISNGTLKVITREGTTTIYRSTGSARQFAAPESFVLGTPIQVSQMHQQVVVDTATGTFTTMNVNTITSSASFMAGEKQMRLGKRGQQFRTILSGHLYSLGPPSGYFAGYATTIGGCHPPKRRRHR